MYRILEILRYDQNLYNECFPFTGFKQTKPSSDSKHAQPYYNVILFSIFLLCAFECVGLIRCRILLGDARHNSCTSTMHCAIFSLQLHKLEINVHAHTYIHIHKKDVEGFCDGSKSSPPPLYSHPTTLLLFLPGWVSPGKSQ